MLISIKCKKNRHDNRTLMKINDHSLLLGDTNVKQMDMTIYLKLMQVLSNATQIGYFLLWVISKNLSTQSIRNVTIFSLIANKFVQHCA